MTALASRRASADMPEDFEQLLILAKKGNEDAFATIWRTMLLGLIVNGSLLGISLNWVSACCDCATV